MNDVSSNNSSWKKSRYGFAAYFFASLLIACFILRVVLLSRFDRGTTVSMGSIVQAFLIGLHQDFAIALMTALPLLFVFWVLPNRWLARRWCRFGFYFAFFIFWVVQIFIFFTEYYFFEEFRSRFNTVAVDYLLYPTEVVGNIRDSYPLYTILAICVGLALAWVIVAFRKFRGMWELPVPGRIRFLNLVGATAACGALALTLSIHGTRFSPDRTLNEIANNGSISFVNAAWTHNLDYSAYYKTLPRDEAFARTRKLLTSPKTEFIGDANSIRRKVAGDPNKPKLNVIILLEESLGSEFWGCLGRTNTLTPEMDKLATQEGLLFTNIYACGNRTVRGFEGVFSSFPPLPGDSIVKRDRSENVESIARVLKRDGYETLFLYGGRGAFDGMRSYAVNNGWDRFIEQKDFEHPTFTTIWGVCNEDLYDRGIEEFRKLAATGKPFLGTMLTVSNHKPYTFPAGRIADSPEARKPIHNIFLSAWEKLKIAVGLSDKMRSSRNKAVKYTDWCLGQFFEKVKKESFWTNTIFVVVADHGARVYGSQEIPIFSYEIPIVMFGPSVVKEPQRIGTLGNSLDVSPTLLGLIGRPYETMFFGRDIFNDPPDTARAVLNHNRKIGMFRDDRLVVLDMQNFVYYYEGDPKIVDLKPVTQPTPDFLELEKDASAIYQVADELYMNRRYRIDGMPAAESTGSPTKPVAAQTVQK
jgi:phosphoglycerol transferase MdoB-like AlkP superfamily enzyme